MRMQASNCWSRSNSSCRSGRFCALARSCGGQAVILVAKLLLLRHRDEIVLDRAARQLALDIGLAAAEHRRRHAVAQCGEILVVDRTPAFVERVKIAVEAEQRPEDLGVEILDDRIELVDAVLSGVPVSTKACVERSDLTRRAVLVCQFLMR